MILSTTSTVTFFTASRVANRLERFLVKGDDPTRRPAVEVCAVLPQVQQFSILSNLIKTTIFVLGRVQQFGRLS